MSLTPQEIVEVELRQALRGYATAEVDDLLRRIAEQMRETDDELADLRTQLDAATDKVAAAEESQSTVQRALITAHAVAEETIKQAQREADELREAALSDLDVDADQARAEVERIIADGQALEAQQRQEFEAARAQLQEAYDRQRAQLGERLDDIRAQLVTAGAFLRDHIATQQGALDALLAASVEEVGQASEGGVNEAADSEPTDSEPTDGEQTGAEPSDDDSGSDGPDTDEIPRVDIAGDGMSS